MIGYRWLGNCLVLTLVGLLISCTTFLGEEREPECPLVIRLRTEFVKNPIVELNAEFYPPELKTVRIYPPGPIAFKVHPSRLARWHSRDSDTISTYGLPIRVELREREVSADWLLRRWVNWDYVAWFDAYGYGYVEPGWYQIQFEYAPVNGVKGRCVVTTAPFYVEEDLVLEPSEAIDLRQYVWSERPERVLRW